LAGISALVKLMGLWALALKRKNIKITTGVNLIFMLYFLWLKNRKNAEKLATKI
jgi:hypothetical protein